MSKSRSALLLGVLCPIFVWVFVSAVSAIPKFGGMAYAALIFPSPGVWLFALMHQRVAMNAMWAPIVIWLHYPVMGWLIGCFRPIDTGTPLAVMLRAALRFAVCLYGLLVAGTLAMLFALARIHEVARPGGGCGCRRRLTYTRTKAPARRSWS